MVVDHTLETFWRCDFSSCGIVAGTRLWIDVYDLPIVDISEEEAHTVLRNHLKVCRGITGASLCFPIVVAEVSRTWDEPLLPRKDRLHCTAAFRQPLSVVYVSVWQEYF